MRRAISAATTMKPTTISRPITTTSTFSQSGAEACEEDGDAKKTSMSEAQRHIVTVDERTAGERLDRALAAALPTLTRSRVKALIESRRVALADFRPMGGDSRRALPQGQNRRAFRRRYSGARAGRARAAGDRPRYPVRG